MADSAWLTNLSPTGLLEKKGVKRDTTSNKVESSDSLGLDNGSEQKEKRSLGDKIKAKLHVH